jgi:hypothetical protein
MSDERMVMLLVGEWCCWRELCVCGHALSGRCEGCCTQVYIRVIFGPWAILHIL